MIDVMVDNNARRVILVLNLNRGAVSLDKVRATEEFFVYRGYTTMTMIKSGE